MSARNQTWVLWNSCASTLLVIAIALQSPPCVLMQSLIGLELLIRPAGQHPQGSMCSEITSAHQHIWLCM